MKKFPFYLFLAVLVLSFLGLSNCSNRKKTGVLSSIVPLALLGTGKTGSPPINKTYPTEETIILNIGQQLTLSPSQHVEGSTYTISPQLPDGLSLDPNTGIISGAPTASFPSTVFTITQTKPDGTKTSWKVTIGVSGNGQNSAAESGTPSFNLPAGHYTEPKYISITTPLSGGTVRCTFDGTEPTSASDEFSEPLHIWSIAGKTIKCRTFKDGTSVGDTVTAVYSYPPLKTGQTTVYQDGDDASMNKGVERSYTDNGDGTVKDNATGLVWMKCSRGQNNDANCSGTAITSNWENAKEYCSGLNLQNKVWRLPSKQELETLPDYGKFNSAIDTTLFPGTENTIYWSSTLYHLYANNVWVVGFYDGGTSVFDKPSSQYVRCVNGPLKEYLDTFTDNGDGTIKDNTTGLLWQKCSFGQSGSDCSIGTATASNWTTSVSYCKGLSLSGKSWRLPTFNELRTIMDSKVSAEPFINSAFFPGTSSGNYWSSTTNAYSPSEARAGSFGEGITYVIDKRFSPSFSRCVSDP